MSTTRLLCARLPVLVLALVCLSACGSDDSTADDPVAADTSAPSEEPSVEASPSTSESASESVVPAGAKDCSAVWKEGARLPFIYPGCVDDGGQFVKRDSLSCSSGQRIVRFDDQFYAVPAGRIHQAESSLEQDKKYRSAVLRCRA